jgi:hypothetical protein
MSMMPKLIIINNGLKDLRGHYFETSVSIAEAARRLGYRPILAAHVTCQRGIMPDWLEFYPLFCTDHWMNDPPAPAPDLPGIGRILKRVAAKTRQTFRSVARGLTHLLRALVAAVLVPACRRLYRLVRSTPGAGISAQPARDQERTSDPLAIDLQVIGAEKEFEYIGIFQRDVERLLRLTKARARDHVFLPTAHGRELIAIQRLLRALREDEGPAFHLEFRHTLDMIGWFEDPAFIHPYSKIHRVLFEHSRMNGLPPKVRVYTDTRELAEEYKKVSRLEFDVLPIPFRADLIKPVERHTGQGLCIAFFGDVRDEKGFYHLPAIVEDLRTDYLEPGRVRFLIQTSLSHPEWNPQSVAALERLRAYPPHQVRLVGGSEPLSPEEYFRLVSGADVLLCPYRQVAYKRRSSGTLAEAVVAGIPTVVPADTWLARQQPPGTGEQFHDEASLLVAVRRICDDHARYHAQAQIAKKDWLAVHNPAALVKRLVSTSMAPTANVA